MSSYGEISRNLSKFSERIVDLESSFQEIERNITKREIKWDTTISEIRREIRHSKNKIQELLKNKEQSRRDFINIVEEFKLRATNEEFQKLQNKIDMWDIDKFITKQEFEQLLNL